MQLLHHRRRDHARSHGHRSRRRHRRRPGAPAQAQLQVKQIVITHAHIDHVGGAMKLRAATGAPILLNQNDYALLKMLDVQAAWIGVPPPGKVEIDHSLTTGETVTPDRIPRLSCTRPAIPKAASASTFQPSKSLLPAIRSSPAPSAEPTCPAAPCKKSCNLYTPRFWRCPTKPSSFQATVHSPRSAKNARAIPFW